MGIELELFVLLILVTAGASIFDVFEVETPAWCKALKWVIVIVATVGLYFVVGSGLASELRAQGDFLSVAACEVRPEARKPVTHVHGP